MSGCSSGDEPGAALTGAPIRLVDHFARARVADPRARERAYPSEVWRAADVVPGAPGWATGGFHAGPGIADLRVEDGRVKGRVSEPQPVLWVGREPRGRAGDHVHSVELRMRVDRGRHLYFSFQAAGDPDPTTPRRYFAQELETLQLALVPGELHDYLFIPRESPWMNEFGSVLLSPSDEVGAEFEIEVLRLVSFSGHLARTPSSVGWRGARGVWKESITAHPSETIRYDLIVPAHAWLDLSLSLVSGAPARFRVAIDGDSVLDQAVEEVDRWIPAPIDLARWAGERISLELALESSRADSVGLWGSPVVRERLPAPAKASASSRPRGVILFLADTLRPDHLPTWGYERETARALPTLARKGVVFRDCAAQATWTLPSTVSLVTSLHPSSHGVVTIGDAVPHTAETLAEAFRAAGHATIAFSAVKFTGRFASFHQGFEELHEAEFGAPDFPSKSAEWDVGRLLPWLELHKDGRFFVFLHVYDPHDPYRPRPPFDEQWADPGHTPEHLRRSERLLEFIEDKALKEIGLPRLEELLAAGVDPSEWIEHEKAWYDGSILGMDREIARVMTQLQALGLLDSTLFVFTSDHGEEFLEHGRTWHGQGVYSELTQVPLLFYGAGLPARGVVIDEPVALIDVMPTILQMCDLRAPASMQGQSLLPLMRRAAAQRAGAPPGEEWKPRPIVTEKAAQELLGSSPPPERAGMIAIQDDRWKLIHNEPRVDDRPEWELFDRRQDPFDHVNLAERHPEVVARLQEALEQWRERVAAVRLDAESAELDPETLARLREMGYAK